MDACTRREVEIRTPSGLCIMLSMDSSSTLYELKKEIRDWFNENQMKDVPRSHMQLVVNTNVLDSGNVTLDDVEKRLEGNATNPLAFSLVIRAEPIWAGDHDFKEFREADSDDEIVRMIQDRGRSWRIKASKSLDDVQMQSSEQLENLVNELDEDVVRSHREAMGLNRNFETHVAATIETDTVDMFSPHLHMLRMHHALSEPEAMNRYFQYFFLSFVRFEGNHMSFEEFQQHIPFMVTSAVQAGQDVKHVKNMLILAYDSIVSARINRLAYEMIDFLVSRKYWQALEEQIAFQPGLLTHTMGRQQTKYVQCFPELYQTVLPEANWSFVQLLLDAGLRVDPQHLLANMKVDANGVASARLRRFLDLDRAAIVRTMAWAAQQTSPDYLKLLLDANVDPSLDLGTHPSNKTSASASPLSLAMESKCPENVALLLSVGAHVTTDICNSMETMREAQEDRVAWVRLRQDRLQKDFPFCYDERKRILCEEMLLLDRFNDLLPALLSASGKRRRSCADAHSCR